MTRHGPDLSNSQRILVLAPTGRDGRAACALIEQAGFVAKSCSGIDELRTELEAGAGAAVIAEEAFLGLDLSGLFEWVEKQPPWSDFPFIVLTTHRDNPRRQQYTQRLIANLRNVTLQERPIQTVTLVSAVQAALRARLRQYEVAKYLAEREQAASRLEQLVGERTRQLQEANNRLIAAQESLTMALEAAQMRTWHLDLAEHRIEGAAKRDLPSGSVSLLTRWSDAVGERLLPEDQRAFEIAFDQARGTGKFHLETRILRDNEEIRWAVAEGRLYRDEQGNPVRLAGTIRDVTERRQVEEGFRQTQKLEVIGQLTGGVAHDFNNLLTAVLGNIELASLRTRDQSLLSILRSAATAAERGAKLTSQLLAFARKQHLAPRVVSLNELVSSMGDMLLQTIGVTIRIETVLEKDLWPVLIDPTQLELGILNLAINSRDAMPHGGRLTVATRNIGMSDPRRPSGLGQRDYVAISVSDTGSGMTQEVAAKAFEPFFTTKPVGQGTGLGLSQVLGFAHQSGGEVRIDSRVGRGTTVTVFLPRSRESLPRMVAEDRPVSHDGKAATILVVDDDSAVRNLTVQALETMNYQVIEAENGRVALDLFRHNDRIDLVLIDLVMPVMNGRQLATRIRAADPERAILFMTGYDDLSGSDDPFARDMVIKKPFKLVELAAAVEQALSGRSGEEAPSWNVTPIRKSKRNQ
ncbi:MAG TPA: response regulator [Stellaceae bacterium]|nr:response regulator [Stellaceae bacterium]